MKRIGKIGTWLFLALVCALVGGGIYLVNRDEPLWGRKETIKEDLVARAERRTLESKLFLSGEIAPAFQVDVKSEVGGRVEKLHVTAGQTVARGDLLAIIDDTELLNEKESALAEVEGARLSVEKTQGNYDRAKALFEEKLISKEVFANLEADLAIAKNNLAKADRRLKTVDDKLAKTRILAPADGTILDVLVSEGTVVTAAASVNSGTLMMNLADLSRLLINTHVNQADAGRMQMGQELNVLMQGESADPIGARVEFVAPIATVKNNIKGFAVQALILQNDERLKPGMSVSMELSMGRASEVVSVPIAAVFKDEDQRVVYVRGTNGGTEKRPVEIGLTNFGYAEIKSGLNEGEEILLFQPKDATGRS